MDWIGHLNFEIERRDRRQAYLWAILVSASTASIYVASYILWNLTGTFGNKLAAAGLGSILFVVLASKFAARLWEEMHLDVAPDQFSLGNAVLLIRYIRAHGFVKSFLADVPLLLAHSVITFSLAYQSFHTPPPFNFIGWALVGLSGYRLLVEVGLYLLPRKLVVGILSIIFVGIAADAPNWKALKKHASSLVGELRAHPVFPGIKPTLTYARRMAKSAVSSGLNRRTPATYIVPIASAIYLLSDPATMLMPNLHYDPTYIALFSSIALVVVLSLFSANVFLLIWLDNTRRLLDQLRYAIFTRRCTSDRASTIFESIDFLQTAQLYPPSNLKLVRDSLDLDGLHAMKAHYHQATLTPSESIASDEIDAPQVTETAGSV